MLGKLIKHEFRATGRVALPLCGLLLALAVAAGLALRFLVGSELSGQNGVVSVSGGWRGLVTLLLNIGFGLSLFAVGVVVFVTLILHYKRSLLGDEGYLTMTLPVSTHALLCSRLLTALAWELIVAAVSVLAVVIAGLLLGSAWPDFAGMVRAFFDEALRYPGLARVLAVSAVDALLSAVFLLLLCYADMTLSHAFRKHKVLYNVIAVVVVLLVMRLVGMLNVQILARQMNASLGVIGGADGPTSIFVTGPALPISVLELLVADVGLYFLTYWFLRRKLNLE